MNNQLSARDSTKGKLNFPKDSIIRINYMRVINAVLGNKVCDKETAEEFLSGAAKNIVKEHAWHRCLNFMDT